MQNKTTDEGRNISPSNNQEHIYTRLPLPKIKFSVLHIAASNPVVGDQNRKVCGPGAQWLLLTLRWLLQLSHSCVSLFLKLILMLAPMANEIMEVSRRKWWTVSANTHCKCFCGDEKSFGVMYFSCVFVSPHGLALAIYHNSPDSHTHSAWHIQSFINCSAYATTNIIKM